MQRCDQRQAFCVRCQRPTLHNRWVYQVPHLIHLLVTLFLCGFWLPIWLLHAAVNCGSSEPFLCTTCGQRLETGRGMTAWLWVGVVVAVLFFPVFGSLATKMLSGDTETSEEPTTPDGARPQWRAPVATKSATQVKDPVTRAIELPVPAPYEPPVRRATVTHDQPPTIPRPEQPKPEPPAPVEPDLRPTFPTTPETTLPTSPPTPIEPVYRTWTLAVYGTVEARFRGVGFGKVTLETRSGSKITVPVSDLSEADQEWIKSRRANSHLLQGDGQ